MRKYRFFFCLSIFLVLSGFTPIFSQDLHGKVYRLVTFDGTKAIDGNMYNIKENGCYVQVWDNHIGTNQQWKLERVGEGNYLFHNMMSNICLDASLPDIHQDVVKIQLWTCHFGANQQWRLVDAGNGYFYIFSAMTNKCLQVYEPTIHQNGGPIQLANCTFSKHQQWKLEEVKPKQ